MRSGLKEFKICLLLEGSIHERNNANQIYAALSTVIVPYKIKFMLQLCELNSTFYKLIRFKTEVLMK